MSVRFLHTADWQLGKAFASVDDESKRHRLQQERIEVVRRMAGLVRESEAAFVLVAGDLFDSPRVTNATVSAACAAIGALEVPVIVVPGNHDHGGPGSLWEQDFFVREQRALAPNLRVLLTPEPVILDRAVILPAPLLRRHESGDPTAWIRQSVIASLPDDLPRVVLAHGTVQGFGSVEEDGDGVPSVANWINLAGLPDDAIDYIALGDWHGTKQVAPKAWYSGTPEIDRFPKGEGNDPGNLLKVTASRSDMPQVEKIAVGRFAWEDLEFRFSDDLCLERLVSEVDERIGRSGDELLLRLVLDGSLGIGASAKLERVLESWGSRLLRLKLDSRVRVAPSDEEIAALTRRSEDPLISLVASELVDRARGEDEDAAVARLAMRELHSFLA